MLYVTPGFVQLIDCHLSQLHEGPFSPLEFPPLYSQYPVSDSSNTNPSENNLTDTSNEQLGALKYSPYSEDFYPDDEYALQSNTVIHAEELDDPVRSM